MAPLIGITFGFDVGDNWTDDYIRAITDHGGIPYSLSPGVPNFEFDDLHGLLLTGGSDIHPDNYGEVWDPLLQFFDTDRDDLEIPLCRQALNLDLPVFGICRGMQIMNVATGGNLYQDIPSHVGKYHKIQIENNSLLSELVGKNTAVVNSAHHQAVDKIGGEFVVTARSADGIIEAIEDPSQPFVLGVQYHPERMLQTVEFRQHRRKLFQAFINAATINRKTPPLQLSFADLM